MKALYQRLGITHALTTAYHPQSNGQTERANQEVERHLRLFTNSRQDDWVRYLPTAEFVLNSRRHSAHQMAPFEVMYGYCPDFTVPAGPPTKFPALNLRLKHLQESRKEAEAALREEKRAMKQAFEMGKMAPHIFVPGQKVWLSAKDISLTAPSRKLAVCQLGPYTIAERTGELTYRLILPPTMRQHPVFHVDRLSPWEGNDVQGQHPPPPDPIQVDNDLEYEVEEILDSRKYRNQLQYLIKWQGYNQGHNSWEPSTNLTHCSELIKSFHDKHPAAPRRIAASIFAALPWLPRVVFTDTGPSLSWEFGAVGRRDVDHKKGGNVKKLV